jgi:hypothetical protein
VGDLCIEKDRRHMPRRRGVVHSWSLRINAAIQAVLVECTESTPIQLDAKVLVMYFPAVMGSGVKRADCNLGSTLQQCTKNCMIRTGCLQVADLFFRRSVHLKKLHLGSART